MKVVEPIHLNVPFPSAGFNKLETSNVPPEAEPAPIMVCISSMNKIDFSWLSRKLITSFNRFSKSPLYLVPAINPPISNR